MTNSSMNANQQEDDEGGHGRCGGDAVDPQSLSLPDLGASCIDYTAAAAR